MKKTTKNTFLQTVLNDAITFVCLITPHNSHIVYNTKTILSNVLSKILHFFRYIMISYLRKLLFYYPSRRAKQLFCTFNNTEPIHAILRVRY